MFALNVIRPTNWQTSFGVQVVNRRSFVAKLSAAGCGLGLTSAAACAPSRAATRPSPQTDSPAARLERPRTGLIQVACTISAATTKIDFVGPEAVFQTWHRDQISGQMAPRFKIFTVAETREPVGGLVPDYTFADAPAPHIVVVPAQTGSQAHLDWLRRAGESADVVMSVCVGARHLALAGLLDGKRATTHHKSIDDFERRFAKTQWVRDVRFMEAGKIATAAGLTAGIDLALHVVARYFDAATARFVADHIEYEGKRWM
jgi:transcriptional regulator GlxA family with amidase domain